MAKKSIPFTLTVVAAPDFFPAVGPTALLVVKGVVGIFNVTLTGAGGFAAAVALAVVGLPVGAVATFDKPSIKPGEASVLSITTAGMALGVFPLVLEGTAEI